MENLTDNNIIIIFLISLVAWLVLGVLKTRLFWLLATLGLLFNSFIFLKSLEGINPNILAIVFSVVWALAMILGSKTVPFNTQTILWDGTSEKPMEVLFNGFYIIDPIFQYIAIGVKTQKNECIDMQKVPVKIHKTAPMLTATPGIRAIISDLNFMIKLNEKENIMRILDIDGGFYAIKDKITDFVKEFLIKKIAKIEAVTLETGGHNILHNLEKDLIIAVNSFCENRYPYEIEEITMADIVLPEAYYDALREKVIAILKADAADETAKRLVNRIVKAAGEFLDENATKEQKLLAAQISLGIVKRDIKDNNFGITGLTGEENKKLAKEIAIIALTKKAV